MKISGNQLQLFRTLFVYAAGAFSNVLFSYLLIYLLLTNLSKSDYGQYGYLLSVGTICLIGANLGHKESFFKVLSARLHPLLLTSISQSFVIYNGVLSLTIIGLFWLNKLWFWVGLYVLITNWFLTFSFVLKARERYSLDSFLPGVHKLLWSLFFLLVSSTSTVSLEHVFISGAAALLLVMLHAGCGIWGVIKQHYCYFVSKQKFWRHGDLLTKFFLIEVVTVLYLKVDILLLNRLGSSLEDIADYYLSVQVFDIGVMILSPLGYFFFNRYSQSKPGSGVSTALYMAAFCTVIAALMHGFLWLFLSDIFEFVSQRYAESHQLVNLAFFAIYPVVFNIFLSNLLIAINYEKAYLVACGFALLFNVGLNILYIPEFGVWGAATIKIGTEAVITLLLLFVVLNHKKRMQI